MSPLRLTIITVCYQSAAALERTIANVAGVKRPGITYLVIDGGSDDGTRELLERSGTVVDGWISERDSGIYDAMNKGWLRAPADARVLYLGAGDKLLALPEALDRFEDDVIVYGDVMIGDRRFHSVSDYRLRFSNTLHHQALLVPKSLHPEPPFDTRFPVYADFDFNLRLMRHGARFAFAPDLLGYAEPGGVSEAKLYAENFRVVRSNLGVAGVAASALFLTARKLLQFMGIRALTP